jgi:hypothetical protein
MTTKADWETKPGPPSHQQPKVVSMGSRFRRDNLASTRGRVSGSHTGIVPGEPAIRRAGYLPGNTKSDGNGVINRASQ